MKITDLKAIEILDSRGNPTVRTFITLEDGSIHSSSVPSGASTGSHEAVELRDEDNTRYMGKGVLKAVAHVNTEIRDALVGMEVDPIAIDTKMLDLDGTPNKESLGANAILSVSQAAVRAGAYLAKKPLWKFMNEYYFNHVAGSHPVTPTFPQLLVNIVNGGKHANWNFDIQEFMIVPNATSPSKSVRIAAEIFHSLGKVLKEKKLSTLLGDEGGYSPARLASESVAGAAHNDPNQDVLNLIITAASDAGYENVTDFRLSLDVASTEFYSEGNYTLNAKKLNAHDLLSYYKLLTTNYKLLSIEDAFAEDDWEAWTHFVTVNRSHPDSTSHPEQNGHPERSEGSLDSSAMPQNDNLVIIGDDLLVTNPTRIKRAIEEKAANAVLVKVNQIGTIKETVEAIQMAHAAGWKTAISHRSGETEDSFIADLAYACASEFIKTGSMARGERLAKYNRLLEIEAGL